MAANSTSFKKGRRKTGGRKAGVPNKLSADFIENLLSVAEALGSDGAGTDGVVGYLKRLGLEDPAVFCKLLLRVMDWQQKMRNRGNSG